MPTKSRSFTLLLFLSHRSRLVTVKSSQCEKTVIDTAGQVGVIFECLPIWTFQFFEKSLCSVRYKYIVIFFNVESRRTLLSLLFFFSNLFTCCSYRLSAERKLKGVYLFYFYLKKTSSKRKFKQGYISIQTECCQLRNE